ASNPPRDGDFTGDPPILARTRYLMRNLVFLMPFRRVLAVLGAWGLLLPSLQAAPPVTNPPFSLVQSNSAWWLRAPNGRPFFSLGVGVVTPGPPKDWYDVENPCYAWWKYYPNSAAWSDDALRRLKQWGFTTLGAWNDLDLLRSSREQTLWLTPVLHIGSTAGAPWWDMWEPKNVRRMEQIAREQIPAVRNDPRLLGYYSDNELGWWNATLWKMTFEQPPSSGQRQRLVRLLRESYRNDWRQLLVDFRPEHAANWAELQRGGTLFLRPGGAGIRVMREFLGLLADRYYHLMRDIIHKLDPRALYLGDRYQSFFYPEVARACARYADAVSSNLNASWSDGTSARCYLDTLHALTGKPLLISEFYLAARDNRSGNRNSQGLYPLVNTQRERAEAARGTLRELLGLPYVVGADWFQYFDEPTHGRDDGENFNFGLVDIHNQPYDELTRVFADLKPASRHGVAVSRPDASHGIPRAPADPFGDFTPGRALQSWPREQGFVPPSSELPLADLYACWSAGALYLGLFSFDIIESGYYSGASVPKEDRPLWTIQIDGQPPLHARIGAGREPILSDNRARLENLSGQNLSVRNVAALELPAETLGRKVLRAGDTIELSVTLLTHARANRIEWKGKFSLRE
nr:hypothetical protein [Verrucomicrobiae bacterium]